MNTSIPNLSEFDISLATRLVRCSFFLCSDDELSLEKVLRNYHELLKVSCVCDTSYYFDYVCENAIVHIFNLSSTIGFCLEEYLNSDFIS